MAKRAKVTVRHEVLGEWVLWVVRLGQGLSSSHTLKAIAVSEGAKMARTVAPAELYVFNRKGRISERRTYRGDPERRPG